MTTIYAITEDIWLPASPENATRQNLRKMSGETMGHDLETVMEKLKPVWSAAGIRTQKTQSGRTWEIIAKKKRNSLYATVSTIRELGRVLNYLFPDTYYVEYLYPATICHPGTISTAPGYLGDLKNDFGETASVEKIIVP